MYLGKQIISTLIWSTFETVPFLKTFNAICVSWYGVVVSSSLFIETKAKTQSAFTLIKMNSKGEK